MRIGLNATALVAKASVAAFVEHATVAQEDGFDSYWVAEHPTGGLDALTVLTKMGIAALAFLSILLFLLGLVGFHKSTFLGFKNGFSAAC